MAEPKKTMWHGELRDMGQVEVEVKSEARKSKYGADKPDYVEMIVGGHLRQYQVESPQCGEFFRGKVGQSILIEARDSREQATIHAMAPAKGQQQAATPRQPTNVAPSASPTTNQPPANTQQPPPNNPAPPAPAPAKKTADEIAAEHFEAGRKAVIELMKASNRKVNGLEVIMKSVDYLAKRRQDSGKAMTPEHYQGTVTSIYISCERAGLIDSIPTGDLDKYLPEPKAKQ